MGRVILNYCNYTVYGFYFCLVYLGLFSLWMPAGLLQGLLEEFEPFQSPPTAGCLKEILQLLKRHQAWEFYFGLSQP